MPQMSPLFWANLFMAFSALLLVSFIKIYFSTNKNLELQKKEGQTIEKSIFSWTW